MKYQNLKELYFGSAGSRRFFLSQSVEMQLELAKYGDYIHSAADLHRMVDAISDYRRAVEISEMLFSHHSDAKR